MDKELSNKNPKNLRQPALAPWWLLLVFLVEGLCLYAWLWATEPMVTFTAIIIAIPLALLAVKHESPEVKEKRTSQPWQKGTRTFPLWCVRGMYCMSVLMALIIAASFLLS